MPVSQLTINLLLGYVFKFKFKNIYTDIDTAREMNGELPTRSWTICSKRKQVRPPEAQLAEPAPAEKPWGRGGKNECNAVVTLGLIIICLTVPTPAAQAARRSEFRAGQRRRGGF